MSPEDQGPPSMIQEWVDQAFFLNILGQFTQRHLAPSKQLKACVRVLANGYTTQILLNTYLNTYKHPDPKQKLKFIISISAPTGDRTRDLLRGRPAC